MPVQAELITDLLLCDDSLLDEDQGPVLRIRETTGLGEEAIDCVKFHGGVSKGV